MAANVHVNPRVRAYGKARLDIARRAKTRDEWEDLWKPPINQFPFKWGRYWKQCIEYRVEDYAAEVGFFIDILGFAVNAFDPNYAQFTSPDGEFFIAIVPAGDPSLSTPPNAIRLQFMIQNIHDTTRVLEQRGVIFDQMPQPIQPGASMHLASFYTPHGILIELWGEEQVAPKYTFKIADQTTKQSVILPRVQI
jgi:catechol 2,3-dioxygenase-like lactoylglutathione lyase family enzyme